MADRSQKKKKKSAHPWRENIEALVMAVVVALVFKVFFLEISKIPSGSMQPTLMGSPTTEVFDRIVVDKLSMHFRDPRRFEIVVFKHPLERSRIMVKRLAGMPGEEFRIEYGDLWTRPGPEDAWQVLRRPADIMDAGWRSLDSVEAKRSSWKAVQGTTDWRITGRSILARGAGRAGFRPELGSITNLYTDGYHDSLRAEIGNRHLFSGIFPVGDLRLTGEVAATAGTETVILTLTEGRTSYAFQLPGPGADADAKPSVLVIRGDRETRTEAATALRLDADDSVRFSVENLDDALLFLVDGRELLRLDVEPVALQRSSVSIEVGGESESSGRIGATFEDLQVYRDTYYYFPERYDRRRPSPQPVADAWQVSIPEGHYMMLGDNTLDSADSRDWKKKLFTWKTGGELLTRAGNFREGASQPNPIRARVAGEKAWAFRDRWGERHWIPFAAVESQSLQGIAAPLVPRELIIGRAQAVFWPLVPSRKMWRLGWLH